MRPTFNPDDYETYLANNGYCFDCNDYAATRADHHSPTCPTYIDEHQCGNCLALPATHLCPDECPMVGAAAAGDLCVAA